MSSPLPGLPARGQRARLTWQRLKTSAWVTRTLKCLSTALACCGALRLQSTQRQRPAPTWDRSCGEIGAEPRTALAALPPAPQPWAHELPLSPPGCQSCWGCEGWGPRGVLTVWYGSPDVRMILPSCLATCAGGKTTW